MSISSKSAAVLGLCAVSMPAFAQTQKEPAPLEITITANRSPTEIQRTGSAITVISGEEIRKTNPGSLVDALRRVPGLDLTESGGPGAVTALRLRGANAAHTLVLIDGMRINDPSVGSGEFDFSNFPPGLIDRIEVLRGPQSALYGSDALGGVVNIITKRGRGPLTTFMQIEGGSYGTLSTNAGFYGTNGPWSYSFAASGVHSDGFSRYGYRIRSKNGYLPLERDATNRAGLFGRVGYNPGTGFRFEAGLVSSFLRSGYDAAFDQFGSIPDTPSIGIQRVSTIFTRAELDTFDNRLTQALTLNASRTQRFYRDVQLNTRSFQDIQTWKHLNFTGDRLAAEYEGRARLGAWGTMIFGARLEREAMQSYNQTLISTAFWDPVTPRVKDVDAKQTTQSAFLLWQGKLGERFDASLGGRIDKVVGGEMFATWRATGAYRIEETGTKLRASLGTGGKAPTLYQRFGGLQGSSPLSVERSFGGDIGFDQSVFGGRATLSVTAFANRFRDLIDFRGAVGGAAPCQPLPLQIAFGGCFVNVARAETKGVEVEGSAILWQDKVSLKGNYTFLRAKDLSTRKTLARRAEHVGKAWLVITPFEKWSIEPSVTLVSKRFSSANEQNLLKPYARFDLLVSYDVNANLNLYVRGENLNNARYSEVLNYGTTGRAIYAGLKTTW